MSFNSLQNRPAKLLRHKVLNFDNARLEITTVLIANFNREEESFRKFILQVLRRTKALKFAVHHDG